VKSAARASPGKADGRTTPVSNGWTPEFKQFVACLYVTFVPEQKLSCGKVGFKKPPRKLATAFTYREFVAAVKSLIRRFGAPIVGGMYRNSADAFRELIVQEVKQLSCDRSRSLASAAPDFEKWERRKKRATAEDLYYWARKKVLHTPGIHRCKCRRCRKRFYAMRPHAKFCSRECRIAARTRDLAEERRQRRKTYCRQCYKHFRATRGDSRYCSAACRLKHFRQKRRDDEAWKSFARSGNPLDLRAARR
jgi:hypothetical protein